MKQEEVRQSQDKVPFYASLQMKYAMSYLAVLAVVLVLMNTYPILASQDLLFRAKRDSLRSQTTVMSVALMELESLSADQVERVMSMLDSSDLTRVVVTDPAGLILYDSAVKKTEEALEAPSEEEARPGYRYALFQEIVLALAGNQVAYSRYEGEAFRSSAAAPVVYRSMTIGAVYVYEVDGAQGELLLDLQKNLRAISVIIALVALVMSALFSNILTGRITTLLSAIRIVGDGEYGHRLEPVGRDELAYLAKEFNQLTDRLQTTEEVRRCFVSDASHELKTPLASIRLLTDSILQSGDMDQETVRDFVSDIGEEAGRLTRITEHLLTLTRLDSQPVLQQKTISVSWVVQRVLNSLAPLAEAGGIALERHLKPDCYIRCTEDDLHQVCYNLVENAIKYNRHGGWVMVKVHSDREQVYLEVADTGVGIPEEDRPKIFNRFYRVDKARSRAAGGTGLGLSIVSDTVRRHRGWVSVKPRQPNGSVFTIGFPRVAEEEAKE